MDETQRVSCSQLKVKQPMAIFLVPQPRVLHGHCHCKSDFVDCRQNVRWHICQHMEILRKQFSKPSMNIIEHQSIYIVSADIVENVWKCDRSGSVEQSDPLSVWGAELAFSLICAIFLRISSAATGPFPMGDLTDEAHGCFVSRNKPQ